MGIEITTQPTIIMPEYGITTAQTTLTTERILLVQVITITVWTIEITMKEVEIRVLQEV